MGRKSGPVVLKVVTVDDSSLIVDRLTGLLGDVSGCEFSGNASSIPVAIELIETKLPDVVILDINLGNLDGKNGIDLLNIVRKTYPAMKIIMFTNFTDVRYKALCDVYGADYFLDKSNDYDKIPLILNQILQSKIKSG